MLDAAGPDGFGSGQGVVEHVPSGSGGPVGVAADVRLQLEKHRLHLDLISTDRTRDEEVERAMGIGAIVYAHHRKPDGPCASRASRHVRESQGVPRPAFSEVA
jgi:hypothetical protein